MKIFSLSAIVYLPLALYAFSSFADSTEGQILSVVVEGAIPDKGQVILSVFDSEEEYLKNPMINVLQNVNSNGIASFAIADIKEGNYAISAVYDEDKNGELNTGFMGIPTELVGFSNNAKGFMGPPSYEKAEFEFKTSMEISILLGKAKK